MKTNIQDFLYGVFSVLIGLFFGIIILLLSVIGIDNWYEVKKQLICFQRWIFNK